MREDQRGEEAARASADDDRPGRIGGGGDRRVVTGVRRELHVAILAEPREHIAFVLDRDINRIDEADVALIARVMAAPGDREADQLARGNPQAAADGSRERFVGMVKGQLQFTEADHRRALTPMISFALTRPYAVSIRRSACARASSVMVAPDNMRAISSRRSTEES